MNDNSSNQTPVAAPELEQLQQPDMMQEIQALRRRLDDLTTQVEILRNDLLDTRKEVSRYA